MVSDSSDKYRQDLSPEAFDHLVAEHWPMVLSICRGYLADPHEAEDAAQETFIKLMRHIDNIKSSVEGWLSATARTTCIDLVRKRYRQRTSGAPVPIEQTVESVRDVPNWSVALGRLDEAMGHIDANARDLLIERFLRQTPIRVLAGLHRTSMPTMSRRCAAAIRQLAEVFDDMGLVRMDDTALAQWLAKVDPYRIGGDGDGHGLRCGENWRDIDPMRRFRPTLDTPAPPGWTRPIRVGVMVSLDNLTSASFTGFYVERDHPVTSLRYLNHPGYEFFAVIDPGTADRGPVESTIRDYEIRGGLMTWADKDALASLDVIVLGNTCRISLQAIENIHEAVRSGVGLYNEHGLYYRSAATGESDGQIPELMLSGSRLFRYCTPGEHNRPRPVTVIREHPIIDGLGRGAAFDAYGCGRIFTPAPHATVLIEREDAVLPTYTHVPGMAPQRMSVLLVGQVGDGRVVYINCVCGFPFHTHPALRGRFATNCYNWLAEPRRVGDAAVDPASDED